MLRTPSLAPWMGLLLAAGVAWGQSPPGQFEREFQREPEPRVPPEPIVPAGAEERAPAGADQVRFVLTAVEVDGVTVYPAAEIRAAYADLLGTEITLARVYDLAAALTRKYRNDGYVLSQVVVPQQAIRAGSVRLQAIEGYVASVRLEGEVLGPRADLDAYTDRIRASRPLRAADLERYLLLINELAGVHRAGDPLACGRARRFGPDGRSEPASCAWRARPLQPRQQVARAVARRCVGGRLFAPWRLRPHERARDPDGVRPGRAHIRDRRV